jgi:hypothetical protein
MARPDCGPWHPQDTLPDAFLAVPQRVYQDQPDWIPESIDSVRQQFSSHNRWFENGKAWLGVHCDEARLAGFFNPSLRIDGEPVAFFGYFESVDSSAACLPLFAELRRWASAVGARHLYGPINFTTFGNYRIRLDHFRAPPFPGEPFSPPWYPTLLADAGLSLRYRYVTRINRDLATLVPAVEKYYSPLRDKVLSRFRIDTIDGQFWRSHLDQIYPLVDSIFASNFAYSSIDFESFSALCGDAFANRLCPHSSVAAWDQDDRLAGFFLCFPDYGPLLRQGNPTRIDGSQIRYQDHFALLPRPRMALAKTGGIHPALRESGLFSALSCELTLRLRPHYQQVAAAMVREDNRSLNFAARFGEEPHHYGLFSAALDQGQP